MTATYDTIARRHRLKIFIGLLTFELVLWGSGLIIAFEGFGDVIDKCRPDTVSLFTWQEFVLSSVIATACCMPFCAPLLMMGWGGTSSRQARVAISACVLLLALVANRAIQFDWVKACFGATW